MAHRKRTQKERIRSHLAQYGKIDDTQARDRYGIRRLGARIWELRHDEGLPIETIKTKGKNRYGETTTFATYKVDRKKMKVS